MDIRAYEGDVVQAPLVKDKVTYCERGREEGHSDNCYPNFHHCSFSHWMESLFVL